MYGILLAILLGGAPTAPQAQEPWPVVIRPAVVLDGVAGTAPEPAAEPLAPPEAKGPGTGTGEGAIMPYTLGRAIVTRRTKRSSHR